MLDVFGATCWGRCVDCVGCDVYFALGVPRVDEVLMMTTNLKNGCLVQNISGTVKGSDHTPDMHVCGSRVVFSESIRVIDLGNIVVEFQSVQVIQSNTGVKQSKEQVKNHLVVMRLSGLFLIFFWVTPDKNKLVKTRSGCP